MRSTFAYLLLLCSGVVAEKTGSPVEKVVQLLTELRSTMESDGKSEQKLFDKTACWCDRATHAKADAIDQAQKDIRVLSQEILTQKGKVATLTQMIADDMQNIKESTDTQETEASVRAKENGEFMEDSKKTTTAMAALEKAIKVLQKGSTHDGKALIQTEATQGLVRHVIEMLPSSVTVKENQLVMLEQFAEGKSEYAPQSLTVLGILTDMYETFAADLESATNTEATKYRAFEDLYASEAKQISSFKKDMALHKDQKAEAEAALAQATQSFDDTTAQMKADIKFFDETKDYCYAKHKEYEERKKNRMDETAGIEKAIEILTSDEARETFRKAIKPGKEVGTGDYNTGVDTEYSTSFLQIADENAAQTTAMRAFSALKAGARASHSLRLARLAASVGMGKLGHFKEIVDKIDEMIQVLKDEEQADTDKRDQCKEEYHKIDGTSAKLKWDIEKNEAKIDKLENLIKKRTAEKMETIEEIKQVSDDIKAMEDQRKAENADFHNEKDLDTNALRLLIDARDALSAYYKKNDIEMGKIQESAKDVFLQEKQEPVFEKSMEESPDAKLSDKGSHKQKSKGIISIMTMLIEDLNDEIKNGMKQEESAQQTFVERLKAANDLKAELTDKKGSLEEAISERNQDVSDETASMNENKKDLEDEQTYFANIKTDCDFAISTFEERMKKRGSEMHGLVKAKEFLTSDFVAAGNHDEAVLGLIQQPNAKTYKALRSK